jgi:hypothetical protein
MTAATTSPIWIAVRRSSVESPGVVGVLAIVVSMIDGIRVKETIAPIRPITTEAIHNRKAVSTSFGFSTATPPPGGPYGWPP